MVTSVTLSYSWYRRQQPDEPLLVVMTHSTLIGTSMEHVYIRKCRKRNLKRMCLHQREGVVEGVVKVDDQQVVVRVMLINQKRRKIAARGLKETCSECVYLCVCMCVTLSLQ